MLEVCLKEKGINYERRLLADTNDSEVELSKVATFAT